MKIQTALLHTIGLALCTASCDTGFSKQKQASATIQTPRVDSPVKKRPPSDTLITDSLHQKRPGYCPPCGMG